jgi:Ca2+-binding RTX toxin-like protein
MISYFRSKSIFRSAAGASPSRRTTRLMLELLEDRDCPAIGMGTLQPIVVPNSNVIVQSDGPSDLNSLAGTVDPNRGAVLEYSTLTIVAPPQYAQVTPDPTNGMMRYTPNYLLPGHNPMPTGLAPDQFQFTIRDSLGAVSNVATVAITGEVSPVINGFLVANDSYAVTDSLQSVATNVLANVVVNDGSQIIPSSVQIVSGGQPSHGTVSIGANGVITYTPNLGYVGFDTIQYTVSDTAGNTSNPAHLFVLINATTTPRLQSDPLGGEMLVVDGTPGDDTIRVTRGRLRSEVMVSVNGVVSGPFDPTSRIVIMGYGGNDNIQVGDGVKIPAWLVAGPGNDYLIAGGGPAVLIGGDGDDTLIAGRERDIIIEGAGTNTLISKPGDLVVPGSTALDTNQQLLSAILSALNFDDGPDPGCHHFWPVDRCGKHPFWS